MINVGKAFTWDLLGSAYYMGELAARYPARKVNRSAYILAKTAAMRAESSPKSRLCT